MGGTLFGTPEYPSSNTDGRVSAKRVKKTSEYILRKKEIPLYVKSVDL